MLAIGFVPNRVNVDARFTRTFKMAWSWARPWCANRSPVPKVYFWIFTIDQAEMAASRGEIDFSSTVPETPKPGRLNKLKDGLTT